MTTQNTNVTHTSKVQYHESTDCCLRIMSHQEVSRTQWNTILSVNKEKARERGWVSWRAASYQVFLLLQQEHMTLLQRPRTYIKHVLLPTWQPLILLSCWRFMKRHSKRPEREVVDLGRIAESGQGWDLPERKGTSYQAALYSLPMPFKWHSSEPIHIHSHQVTFKRYLKATPLRFW